MKCQKCGNEVVEGIAICPACGAPMGAAPVQGQYGAPMVEMSTKSRVVYDLLGFFFGYLRVHDFYRGKIGGGIGNLIAGIILLAILVVGFGPFGLGLAILIFNLEIGIELLVVKNDAKGKLMQGSNVAGIILGILTILAGVVLCAVFMFAGAAVLASMSR